MLSLPQQLLLLGLRPDGSLWEDPRLLLLLIVHLLQVGHIPELDPVIMADTRHNLSCGVDIQSLYRKLVLMVTNYSEKSVRVKMNSSNITILAASDDHIVSDWNQSIDTIRMSWELVRVQPILVLAE